MQEEEEDNSKYIIRELSATSTPIKGQQLGPVRRRSVSSIAFIYKCNHHAAGVACNCYESDIENSVSYKLKKKYMQSLQSCGCNLVTSNNMKETLDRKNSLTLDGIKEVRESVENLLEKVTKTESGCGRCDSGVSTADNSVGDDIVYKKKLQSTCSCQFYRETCTMCSAASSSTGSNQDHTENQQDSITEEGSDGFGKRFETSLTFRSTLIFLNFAAKATTSRKTISTRKGERFRPSLQTVICIATRRAFIFLSNLAIRIQIQKLRSKLLVYHFS